MVLAANATVANVNAAAGVVGATAITFSRPGSPFMTFAVPRQASATDLEALARRLQGLPGILFVSAGRQADPLELPATGGVAASVDDLSHLLATRFPAAWNARRIAATACSGRKVTLIVPDIYFGLPADFAEQMEGSVILDGAIFEPIAPQEPQPHGYQVVGTLAAKFDALLSTGANPLPACLRIKLVNMHDLTLFEIVDKTIAAVRLETGHVIVSSSVGYKNSFICGPSGNDECAQADVAAAAANIRDKIRDHFVQGIQWAVFAMQPAVVDRMLVVQAAGNDADAVIGRLYPGQRSARLGSPFAIDTTLGNLDTVLADTALWRPAPADPALPDLALDAATVAVLKALRDQQVTSPVTDRNLVLVGGTTNTPVAADLLKDARSNDGAALLAVGKDISTVDFAVVDGTSFAAPQVAGLAAYLWLLDSTLAARPVQDTITALRATTQGNAALTGIVDAYATVLSLDEAVAVTPTTAKIRLALVDVAGQIDAGGNPIGDGRFDLADLQAFRAFYLDAAGAPIKPTTRTYSRFDLNGDGFTGGGGTTRMDLDPQESTRFGAPQFTTFTGQAGGVAQTYNESAITHAGALCFFATSALYTGTDLAARDALLRELCLGAVDFELSAPSPIGFCETGDVTATVVGTVNPGFVFSTSGGGTFGPQRNFTTARSAGTNVVFRSRQVEGVFKITASTAGSQVTKSILVDGMDGQWSFNNLSSAITFQVEPNIPDNPQGGWRTGGFGADFDLCTGTSVAMTCRPASGAEGGFTVSRSGNTITTRRLDGTDVFTLHRLCNQI